MLNRAGEQPRARVALAQNDACQPREVEGTEHQYGDADDGSDAGDLFGTDAQSHTRRYCDTTSSFFRPGIRPRSLFSLLCSVFRLIPRISAARVLLSRVCSSVIRIKRRSASSTVVPGDRAKAGWPDGGVSTSDGGRCRGSMNSPSARIVARSITLRSSRTLPGQ